jgi:hypothetical protein
VTRGTQLVVTPFRVSAGRVEVDILNLGKQGLLLDRETKSSQELEVGGKRRIF